MPIKLFDITSTRAHVTDKPDTAFKLLQIQNISEHTKHAVFLLNMSVIYFLKGHCEESLSLAKKAKNIVVANLGIFHYLHGVLLLQISLALEQTQSKTKAIKYHQEADDVFKSLQLENHPNILNCLTAVTKDEEINRPHVNPLEINFTKVMFQMVDYPFAWIDFHPSNHLSNWSFGGTKIWKS